jgi:hypothetical protein
MELIDAKRYVTLLYREVLGREPDAEGFKANVEFLEKEKTFAAAESLLHKFLSSPEACTGLGPRLFGRIGDPIYNDEPISFVISLGTHCYTSSMLGRQQLRTFSGPFDWLFSNLGMIAHCLDDDFKIFLDPQYYRLVPVQERRDGPGVNLCDHAYYLQHFKQQFVFNHVDPTSDEGLDYLKRCVDRMRSVLAAPDKKLFVCVTLNSTYSSASIKAVFDAVARRTNRFDLISIAVERPDTDAIMPVVAPLTDVTGPRAFLLRPVSELGGTAFTNPIDELPIVRLLHQYAFRLRTA